MKSVKQQIKDALALILPRFLGADFTQDEIDNMVLNNLGKASDYVKKDELADVANFKQVYSVSGLVIYSNDKIALLVNYGWTSIDSVTIPEAYRPLTNVIVGASGATSNWQTKSSGYATIGMNGKLSYTPYDTSNNASSAYTSGYVVGVSCSYPIEGGIKS